MRCLQKAIVSSGHPLVSGTAAEILKAGGNAFDAAIAAGFTGAVVEPALTSLGGGGFLLAKTGCGNGGSEEILFDFFVDTPGCGLADEQFEPHFFPITVRFPGSDQIFNIGLGSAAVPGTLKGYLHVHDRLGRLPLQEILTPAIRIATTGFTVNDSQAYFLNLLQPIISSSETGRRLYSKNGTYIKTGDLLVNPELTCFLEQLAEDRGENFYRGGLAETIANDMSNGNGMLTAADLAGYQVIERHPLVSKYRGYTFLTNPPPAVGGSLIHLALSLLDRIDISRYSWGSEEHLLLTAGMMVEVEKLRQQATTSAALDQAATNLRLFSRGTTHLSVADREGNVASMTTSNGEGSGYFVPGTGIMLNNMMGEDDLHPEGFHSSPACQRVSSMMSPSLLVKDDAVALVIGSGGSKRIRTAITQVISNIVDFHMAAQQAVEMPRIHWDGAAVQVEPELPPASVKALSRRLPINLWPTTDMYFGGVHTVIPGIGGGGDPRRSGSVMEVEV
jgi:gamma-glutamyltranspeptidase/glutathione hydrolase